MKAKTKTILTAVLLLLLATVAALAIIAERRATRTVVENAGASEHAVRPVTVLEREGERRLLKKHVDTLLLIGTDSSSDIPTYQEGDIVPYYNFEQADFLVLLVLDNDQKLCTPIQINRDTMVDDPWLSATGDVGGTVFEQIALSHTSGSGKEDSCVNTRNAVSSLLFDLPIDNYMAISMSAIPLLNDLVGGVTVTIVDDLTPVDTDFVQGETVTLRGEQALRFIRARMTVGDGTNISRMRRHRDYLDGFMTSARARFDSDSKLTMKALEAINPYLVTDLTADAMSDVVERLDGYTIQPVQYALGDNRLGEKYYEFYVDEEDLWRIVTDALCEK